MTQRFSVKHGTVFDTTPLPSELALLTTSFLFFSPPSP